MASVSELHPALRKQNQQTSPSVHPQHGHFAVAGGSWQLAHLETGCMEHLHQERSSGIVQGSRKISRPSKRSRHAANLLQSGLNGYGTSASLLTCVCSRMQCIISSGAELQAESAETESRLLLSHLLSCPSYDMEQNFNTRTPGPGFVEPWIYQRYGATVHLVSAAPTGRGGGVTSALTPHSRL